jgi:hypothetical protein
MRIEQEVCKATGVEIRPLRDSGEGRWNIRGLLGVCVHCMATRTPALCQFLPVSSIGRKTYLDLQTEKRSARNRNPHHRQPRLFGRFVWRHATNRRKTNLSH